MTNKANKATPANDATKGEATTPTTTTPANEPTSAYGAFVATLANGGKAPAFVTPRDLAAHFDRDERRVRDWLRRKAGVYATAHKGEATPRHMFAVADPATRAMFDAMSRAFDGASTRKGRAGVAYTEVDWSNL